MTEGHIQGSFVPKKSSPGGAHAVDEGFDLGDPGPGVRDLVRQIHHHLFLHIGIKM